MDDEVARGATSGNGKKREREAGCGQTGGDNETRSETNDATAMHTAVEQAPVSGIPTATPAQVTNKRHKSAASTSDIDPSSGCPYLPVLLGWIQNEYQSPRC